MKKQLKNGIEIKTLLIKSLPLLLFCAAVIVVIILFGKQMMAVLTKPEAVKAYVESKGAYGVIVYLLIQILQVIIAVIPGEPIQIAGGYLFGTAGGFALAVVGIMAGSALAFGIARKFGIGIVRLFVNEEKLLHHKQRLESRKGKAVLFLLFLIPGVPKDLLIYAAGLTPIAFRKFFPIYFFARLPAMFGASFMGAQLGQSNYMGFIIIGVIATVLLVLGYVFKDSLINRLSRTKNKDCKSPLD